MAKKRKSTKKAKSVKKKPKKVAKKKQAVKPKSKPKGKPKAKPKKSIKSKHKEEFKIFLFLAAAVLLLVLLAKNNVDESSAEMPFILEVTTEQVGETNTYIFYYTVANPTQELAECNIIVEIRDVPYVNTITMEPGEEVTAQTEVEMPDGENPIRVYAEC